MELLKLTRSILELNKHCFDVKLNPDDGKFEDETEIREWLHRVGEAYYELHAHVFELIAWNSPRRRSRLNPQLYRTGNQVAKQKTPSMSKEELNAVLTRLGL